MGIFITIILAFFSSLLANEGEDKSQVLLFIYSKEVQKSFSRYQEICEKSKKQDFELLQKMALILLKQGARNSDPRIQRLSLYGASFAAATFSWDILESGLSSDDLQTELIALNLLAQTQDDRINEVLTKLMNSPFLQIRMEAAYYMALKKHPHATTQIEALMYKLPPFFKPYFPYFFSLLGTPDAILSLKEFLSDENSTARAETILNIAYFNRDDLLPFIRKKVSTASEEEKEAAAFAFGVLKDSSSIEMLKKMTSSSSENIRVASLNSLFLLQQSKESKKELEKLSKRENLFAIISLSTIPGTEPTLMELLQSKNIEVRINAAVALLEKRNRLALPVLKEILICDIRDFALQIGFSPGRALKCWKVVSSATQKQKTQSVDLNLSLVLKENLLKMALSLQEDDFLFLAKTLFDYNQKELIPLLISLLENLQTEKVIALLKKNANKPGSPLIRDYCNLALFRLREEGSYEKYVISWILRKNRSELIKFRPVMPKSTLFDQLQYQLTPEETSRLLIEMYAALLNRKDEKSIEIVVEAIKKGNSKNRYALVGLLLKAME